MQIYIPLDYIYLLIQRQTKSDHHIGNIYFVMVQLPNELHGSVCILNVKNIDFPNK